MAEQSARATRAYPTAFEEAASVTRIDSVLGSMARVISEMAATHALLNCLIKEFALPENRARYAWPAHVRGIAPANYLRAMQGKGLPLLIDLPGNCQFLVLVDRRDPLGSQRYLSDLYMRDGNGDWHCPPFAELPPAPSAVARVLRTFHGTQAGIAVTHALEMLEAGSRCITGLGATSSSPVSAFTLARTMASMASAQCWSHRCATSSAPTGCGFGSQLSRSVMARNDAKSDSFQ